MGTSAKRSEENSGRIAVSFPIFAHVDMKSAKRKTKKYDVQFAQFDVTEQLADFGNTDDRLQLELDELGKTIEASRLNDLVPQVRRLLDKRHETLNGLDADYTSYGDDLELLDTKEDSLIGLIEKYEAFVDERVLWIRSSPPVALADIPDSGKTVAWFASSTHWREVTTGFWRGLFGRPVANITCMVGFLSLLVYRLRFRGHINELGKQAASRVCKDFSITLEVLVYTAARAATWPLAFLWMSWNLSFLGESVRFAYPLSSSLKNDRHAELSHPVLVARSPRSRDSPRLILVGQLRCVR